MNSEKDLDTIERIEKAIDQGKFSDAIKALKVMIRTAREEKDEATFGLVNYTLGMAHARAGKLADSVKFYLLALDTFTQLGDESGIVKVLLGLGKVHRWRSDFATAEEFLERYIEHANKMKDKEQLGQGYLELGIVKAERGETSGAISHFTLAISLLVDTDNDYQLSRAYQSLGEVQKRKGNYAEAFGNLVRCMTIAKEIGLKRNFAYASTSVGECLSHIDDLDKAEDHVAAAIDIFESTGDMIGLSDALRVLGMIKRKRGNHTEAHDLLQRSLLIIKKKDIPPNEILIRIELVELLNSQGRGSEASLHISRAIKLAERLENPELEKNVKEIEEKMKET